MARVILTASGGALRKLSRQEAYHASPAQALAHPTWSMGAKVTLDSASLTNKAFEVIEAHWLFGLPGERIDHLPGGLCPGRGDEPVPMRFSRGSEKGV